MTSIAKLTIQGFTFGAALASGGCMPQNQNELEQVRAELATLKAEVAALKSNPTATAEAVEAPAASQNAEAGAAAKTETAENPVDISPADWQAALEQHEKEKRDASWARLREPALFNLAKDHIKQYGASLNSVRCKETSCLVTINIPKAPKQAYEPLPNPWAEVTMLAHAKPIYAGRTLWSYLLPRHEKDTAEASERVNPLELASQKPELVKSTVVIARADTTSDTSTQQSTTASKQKASTPAAGATTAAKPAAPAAQSPASAKSPASNQPEPSAAAGQAKTKAAPPQAAPGKAGTTTTVAARKAETTPAKPPTKATPAKPNAEQAVSPKASPAGETKPKSEDN